MYTKSTVRNTKENVAYEKLVMMVEKPNTLLHRWVYWSKKHQFWSLELVNH